MDGIDDAAYQGFDDEGAAGANDGVDAVPADAAGEDGEEDEEYEEVELEFSEEDIVCYLVDEDDNEIGFILLDDDGNQQEYYYVTDDDQEDEDGEAGVEVIRASDEKEFDLNISRDGVTEATKDMNEVYREGAQVVGEFKSVADEIKASFDFLKNPLG